MVLASEKLEPAVALAQSKARKGELLHVLLPDSTEREAALLVAALYARELAKVLDMLPPARLMELADVSHRFTSDILGPCCDALVRKAERGAWLKPENTLAMLGWATSKGVAALRIKVAQYAASHIKELAIDEAAAEAADDMGLLLLCVQGKK